MNTNDDSTTRGRAFRRVGGIALASGAAVCAAAALFGTLPAQAAPLHHAAVKTSTTHVAAAHEDTIASLLAQSPRNEAEKIALVKKLQKLEANSPDVQNINAYYAAGYKYEDALDLAALWNSSDRNQAKFSAGAKLRAGHALPFAPGQGFQRSYTTTQQLRAYAIAEVNDGGLADRLAASWKVSKQTAKAKAGGLLLANRPVPLADPTPSDGDAATAFEAAHYTYADAEQLAQIWKIDTYSAKVKAGQDLLAKPAIPLPIQP